MKKSTLGIILALSSALFWSTMGSISRGLNSYGFGAFEVVVVRLGIGFAATALYLLFFKRELFKIKIKDLWCFFGTGIASLFLFSICYFNSLNYVTISTATVLVYTSPIYVMILSMLFFKERLTRVKIIAILLAMVGIVLLCGTDLGGKPIGIILALASGFFFSLYTIFSRFAQIRGYNSLTIVLYTFLFSTVASAPFANWRIISRVATDFSWELLLLVIAMGIVTGFLPYVCNTRALELIEASRVPIIATFEPVAASVLGFILFNEKITALSAVGMLLVLLAVLVLNVKFKSRSTPSVK